MAMEWAMERARTAYDQMDDAVSTYVFDGLRGLGCEMGKADPTTGEMPLVQSPTPTVLALLAYITVVVLGLLKAEGNGKGKEKKDPAWLRALVLVHNLFLVGLSAYMALGISWEAYRNKYNVWGNAYDPKQTTMAYFVWVFFVSKLYEFLDTFVMLLKGNTKQVSVLHVYHHGTISLIWWIIAYRAPGGDAYFSAAMNSTVHVFMYLYYFLAAALGKNPKARSRYLWWGKHLTQLQMFQFFLNLCQAYYILHVKPLYVTFLARVLFYYMITLLVLFGNFYVQKHLFARKRQAPATGQKSRGPPRRPKRA